MEKPLPFTPEGKKLEERQAAIEAAKGIIAENARERELQKRTEERKANERTYFVPENDNLVYATPSEEALKKYPWLKAGEVAVWNKNTGKPVYTYVDENGMPMEPKDAAIQNAKAEITGDDSVRPGKEAAVLQLPEVKNKMAVRTKKGTLGSYADKLLKEKFGEDYIRSKFKGEDGQEKNGAELHDEIQQELYDQLNAELREARIRLAVADDETAGKIQKSIIERWGFAQDKGSIETALNDLQAQLEDLKDYAQQRIERAKSDREIVVEQMNRRGAEIDSKTSPYTDQTFNARGVDSEYSYLKTNLDAIDDQIRSWEAVRDSDNIGVLRGMKNTLGDLKKWDYGLHDIDRGVALLTSKGDKQQDLLRRVNEAGGAASFENATTGDVYRWSKIAGQSIPFVADFMMTGGGFKALGKAGGKQAVKWAEKQGMKGLKKAIVKNMGVGAGEIAASYTLVTTLQGLKTAGDIMQRTRQDSQASTKETGNISLSAMKTG